jgi:hypothetical protein
MKILIAYDGSQGADDTLHDFPRAGLSLRVDAPIMSVAEVVAPPAGHTEAAGPMPPAGARPGLRRLRLSRQRTRAL